MKPETTGMDELQVAIRILISTFRAMNEQDRLAVLDALASEFCTGCGEDLRLPDGSIEICHCQNDE